MRIILAIFTDRFEVYGSLKPFFEQYPQYAELKDKIYYTMSRKKLPFEHPEFKLQVMSFFITIFVKSTKAITLRLILKK
jgi:hypothetical protein